MFREDQQPSTIEFLYFRKIYVCIKRNGENENNKKYTK